MAGHAAAPACATPKSSSPALERCGARNATRCSPTRSPTSAGLSAAWARFNGTEGDAERAAERAGRPDRNARVREVPGALQVQVSWEPGRVVAWAGGRAGRPPTATRSRPCSAPRARRRRGGSATRRSRCRGCSRRPRSRFPSARCWAGSSRPAPVKPATIAPERAVAGPRRDLGGRAHRARRDGAAVAPAAAAPWHREQLEGFLLGAVDAGACRRGASQRSSPTRCRAACWRSIRASTRVPLTRSALTGMVDAICRDSARRIEVPAPPPRVRTADRRHRGVPRPPRRQRVRRAAAGRGRARRAGRGWARSVTRDHAATDRAARPARRGRRLAPRGARGRRQGQPGSDRAGDRQRRLELGAISKTRWRASSGCCRRCCAPAAPAAARWSSARTKPGSSWRSTGPRLAAAGFDVRVPALSPRRSHAVAARRSPSASEPSVVGANQLANVRWSARVRRRRAHRGRHRAPGQGSATADPLRRSLGRARPGRPQGGGRSARRARRDQAALGRRDAAARARARGLAARRAASRSRVAAGRPTCSRRRPNRVRRAGCRARAASSASCAATRPRRWRGSASSTPPGSAAASRSTWASARRPRCSRTCSPAPAPARRW